MKQLEYAYPASTISEKAWGEILKPLHKYWLPRTGVASKFPHDVLYGPTCLQGLGLMHPYYHQELKHIEIVLQHVNQGTETGKIIEVAYDNLRLELGVPGPITQQSFQLLGKSTTDTWIHSWWKFGSRFGIMVNDTGPDLKKARANDVFLREAFAAIPNISADDLYLLNTCRMFMRVVTLSDITTVKGDRIEASILEGTPPLQT